MKFCPEHWQALRAAITARGLDALVAESGEQAGKNLVSEVIEGSTIDNFDPLMGAHNAILSQAMHLVTARYKVGCDYPTAFDWTDEMINGASDLMLAEWRKFAS